MDVTVGFCVHVSVYVYAYDTKVETSFDNHSNIHILSYFPNLLISSYTSFKIAFAHYHMNQMYSNDFIHPTENEHQWCIL